MNDSHKVRIGVSAARELEFEVPDVAKLRDAYEKAVKKGDSVLWVEDVRGHTFGIAVDGIAFIEFEKPLERGVGFGA